MMDKMLVQEVSGMVEITLQLPEVETEGVTTEELVERYVERVQPLLRQKLSELVKPQARILTGPDLFRVSFAEFASLDEEDQEELRGAVLRRYGRWVDAELERRQAAWILVVGGEVVSCGTGLDSLPNKSDAYRLGQQKGRAPFLFTQEPLIEEASSPSPTSIWSPLAPDDSYPTLPVLVSHSHLPDAALVPQGLSLSADLDTGSPAVFLSREDVRGCGVDLDILMPLTRFHLGRPYHYVVPTMKIAVPTQVGALPSGVFQVYAVKDWSNSPMTLVNPQRRALVGRNVLLRLGLEINLNGQSRSTTVLR
jgi:hypothetical protein